MSGSQREGLSIAEGEAQLLELAHKASKKLLALGADEARVSVSRARGVDVEWRDGRLERVQEQTQRGLSVTVYVGGRYAGSSTNDLRPEALDAFLAEAVANARVLQPDPFRRLPDPARYAGRADLNLDLYDPSYDLLSPEQRRADAAQLEALVREAAGALPLVSVSAGVGDSFSQGARVHSNGFEGARTGTHFSIGGQATAKQADGRRPMGWAYSSRRHRGDLLSLEAVAAEVAQRAAQAMDAGKLATGRYRVLVENRAVGKLLGALLAPLSGAALQQRQSLWLDRVGTQIASPLLSVADDPFVPRGLGSALWDADGFSAQRRPLIVDGVLQTYLIDDYYARKMAVAPTGGSTFNLEWRLGEHDLAQLAAQVGDGVLIDRFLGGNSNATTGEFSFGCAGRRIEGGQLTETVAEINMAGQIEALWKSLSAVGADPYLNGTSRCPSLIFEDVQLSGV